MLLYLSKVYSNLFNKNPDLSIYVLPDFIVYQGMLTAKISNYISIFCSTCTVYQTTFCVEWFPCKI